MQEKSKMDISASDDRMYRVITLSANKLECLLISDETTDKGAAAMDVRVGHLSDPDNIPGLAHFLEHMLFMGSSKYPKENEYSAFLSKHGGSSNAFTDTEDTNYHFDVAADNLQEALDIFAQFFIEPLFLEDSVSREICAVDSENAKNLQNDFWRHYQLEKSLCRHDHPFHKFGTGNFETLRDQPEKLGLNLREELIAFHKRYYSANVMKLVVLGKQSLDDLEIMVTEVFSAVPNKDIAPPEFPGSPYTPNLLGREISIVPVRETRSLELFFPMREVKSMYKTKPCHYLSHLLGHEGNGSILALLKKYGWANELSCGQSRSSSDWSSFVLSVDLTEEGLEKVNEVTEIIFAYIDLILSSGPQEWIFKETSEVADCSFRFLSKRRPITYVTSLAGNMHLYENEHLLSGPYRLFHYEPELIKECLSYLTPGNMLLFVCGKQFEGQTELKERWYGTDFSNKCMDQEAIALWTTAHFDDEKFNGELHLPDKNDLIATDFRIREDPTALIDAPQLLIDNDGYRVWWKPDNVFKLPKLNVLARIKSTLTAQSPSMAVLSLMWVEVLDECCIDFSYMASMASLHCSFSNAADGIEINVSGYNHKLNILLKKIVDTMKSVHVNIENNLFERIKDKVDKKYQNFLLGAQPYNHAIYATDLCLEVNKFSMTDKLKAIKTVTIDDLKVFSKRLLSHFYLEMLVHGNSSASEAKDIASTLIDGLCSEESYETDIPDLRIVKLEERSDFIYRFPGFNKSNPNSVVEVLYQIGVTDLESNATLAFLKHLMQEPSFDELRTQEQLGYIVHSSVKTNGHNVKSLIFLIQSDTYSPIHLDTRIEAFLSRYRHKLVSMSNDEFASHIKAVTEEFLEKNKNLAEESARYWQVICNRSYLFQRYQKLAAETEKLTLARIVRFFDKYVAKEGISRRKLSVQVFGCNHIESLDKGNECNEPSIYKNIDNVVSFKRCSALYPLPKSQDVSSFASEHLR